MTEGFDMLGISLFREESNDELLDDFSEGEIEFLTQAREYFSVMKTLALQTLKSAEDRYIKLEEVHLFNKTNGHRILFGFDSRGDLIAIQSPEEPHTKYVPA